MAELLKIETSSDANSKVETAVRRIIVEVPNPETGQNPSIAMVFEDIVSGQLGKFSSYYPITTSDSEDRVPVLKLVEGEYVPVMVEPTPELQEGDAGYQVPYPKTIGGFELWATVLSNVVTELENVVRRHKGLPAPPVVFVEP